MSSDKKMMLIEASIELFYQQGFWNSSTASIAKHAKVATGTLFNYFSSKERLIDAVYLHIKSELLEELRSSYAQVEDQQQVQLVIENLWCRYVAWGLNNPVKHDLLQQLKLSDLVSDSAQQTGMQLFGELFELMQQWLASGQLKPLEIEYFAELFQVQLEAAINIAKRNNLQDMRLNKHLSFSFNVFWDGVKQNSD